jgi:hypothetical protein
MTHRCPICSLEFNDAATAKRCEEWCATHCSCNLEIGRLAIRKSPTESGPDRRFDPK